MANIYRLNRDAPSSKEFPQPSIDQFMAFCQNNNHTRLMDFEPISSSTSTCFSPVLQRVDSDGNFHPSPIAIDIGSEIPDTISQHLIVENSATPTDTSSPDETILNGSKTIKKEMTQHDQAAETIGTHNTTDDVVFIDMQMEEGPICISDEESTQELINKLMTPGMDLCRPKNQPLVTTAHTSVADETNLTIGDMTVIDDPHQNTTSTVSPKSAKPPIRIESPESKSFPKTSSILKRRRTQEQLLKDANRVLVSSTTRTSSPKTDNFSDESQPVTLPMRTRIDENLKKQVNQSPPVAVTQTVHQVSNAFSATASLIASTLSNTNTAHQFPTNSNANAYLKLTPIVAAHFTNAEIPNPFRLFIRFANRSHYDELDEQSARLILQMPSDSLWLQARTLFSQVSSFEYIASNSVEMIRRRPVVERAIHAMFRKRNYMRDGIAVTQESIGQQSRVLRLINLPTTGLMEGRLSDALSPQLKASLCEHKRRLNLG